MPYIGKTPSQATRRRYYKTASGSETSLSGTMTSGGTLTFTDGEFVDVSVNGVALVAGTDYNTTTANTIGGLSALSANDQVEIIVYDTFSVFSGDVDSDFSVGGNLSVTGTSTFTGAVTADAGVSIDNITIDGTEIDLSSGDLTLDVAGDINLDADGGDVNFKDGGTSIGYLSNSSGSLILGVNTSDADFFVQGNDGGSTINALTIDMSEAGAATFNAGVTASGEITTTNSLSQNSNSIRTAIGNDGGSGTFGTSTNHQVKMFTNNTHVATLTTGGNFNILDGDLVIGTSGHGIDFSANSNVSGMTSELLDSYEEGTFTATLEGSTSNPSSTVQTTSARYTKVGRLVFVQGQFSNVDTTGASGAPRVTGLPFGAATSYATGNVMTYSRFTLGTTASNVSPYVSGTTMFFYQSTNQAGWAEIAHSAGSGAYLAFTATYET